MNEFKTSKLNGNNQKYKGRYINRFMGMKAAPDMLIRGLFPNAKEITESFGAFEATKYLPVDWKDDIAVVCVGDGHTPRTGAVFAFCTKWECVSVDPMLKVNKAWNVDRLTTKRFKIQDTFLEFDKPCIICMVHAHVMVSETLPYIKAPIRHLITMECCVNLEHKAIPVADYEDDNIWSPKNRIKVYENV